jgi:hypothetical protein
MTSGNNPEAPWRRGPAGEAGDLDGLQAACAKVD